MYSEPALAAIRRTMSSRISSGSSPAWSRMPFAFRSGATTPGAWATTCFSINVEPWSRSACSSGLVRVTSKYGRRGPSARLSLDLDEHPAILDRHGEGADPELLVHDTAASASRYSNWCQGQVITGSSSLNSGEPG